MFRSGSSGEEPERRRECCCEIFRSYLGFCVPHLIVFGDRYFRGTVCIIGEYFIQAAESSEKPAAGRQ